MNYNSFKLAGRYIHNYKDNENHYIILIALMYPINKKEPTFIEIDIYDKELITYIDNLNENDLVGIFGHIESEIRNLNDNFNYMNKKLVAEKIITKGN
jgi:hypothetical protein